MSPQRHDTDRRIDPMLLQQNWKEKLDLLVRFAQKRARGNDELGYDMALEAIRRTLDPERSTYGSAKHPDIDLFLGSLVNGLLRNHWQSAATRRERHGIPDNVVELAHSHDQTPEAEVAAHEDAVLEAERVELARRIIALLQEELPRSDPDAFAVFQLTLEGVTKPADQARILNKPVGEVYNIIKRLARVRAALIDAEGDTTKKGDAP